MANQNRNQRTLGQYLPDPGVESRIELFVQTLAPVENYDSQGELVSALTDLRDEGSIGELCLTVWGNRICTNGELSTIDSGKHIVEAIADFYSFAAERDASISPFFRTNTVDASMSGQSFKSIVPPSQCLALYQRDELVGVFPCVIDEETYSVRDAVEQLQARATETTPETLTPE